MADGEPYIIYGDPAYGVARNILSPYRGLHLTVQEKDFNRAMSSVRVSVEWTFGKIAQYFAYLDFKKEKKRFSCSLLASYILWVHFLPTVIRTSLPRKKKRATAIVMI